tara:strand:+ start:236 stop:628 length:393 start_codon:yes stop_codon:yes gene_type:complete
MAITAVAPRGGVTEIIGDASYVFLLRNREIERFEDLHRGIFDVWDGFFGRSAKPTSKEVKDLIALALVGGGKKDDEADLIVESAGPGELLNFYAIAQAVLGVAFMPDALAQVDNKKKEKNPRRESLKSVS